MRKTIESALDLMNLTDKQIEILLRSSDASASEREIMVAELARRQSEVR